MSSHFKIKKIAIHYWTLAFLSYKYLFTIFFDLSLFLTPSPHQKYVLQIEIYLVQSHQSEK